jgi:hypothetical protein
MDAKTTINGPLDDVRNITIIYMLAQPDNSI